ncbi:Uncharacterized membrane protein YeaQ/YmgE, transglycosylase-associated protein family [Propionibacterium cyclohexanicum]|uniref:Uncharacterized membrane protein YeaQ/YmgE, transglycosylase-associated protein family n=1 Tax=Propionibacterium cyclohexanicum TaxID=64702 RepID=A0A1H9SC50_9ACTN|nr:GlsB/YeaQ/YmgE family stress response membrane protein [Propionibacterium cyclohexanicum]SER82498.1 Uncharacterized membrane protein YeaQ/YmgE, transglycosylase-associated protein family [Propionibacterium cyclohexanicum]
MGFLGYLLLGLIAGTIAKAIVKDQLGWLGTLVAGVIGAIVGGWLGGALTGTDVMDKFFSLQAWLFAILGSIIVLLVWGWITNRRSSRA